MTVQRPRLGVRVRTGIAARGPEGLLPQLECHDQCSAGWDQYLPSLQRYIESGTGSPFRA